MTSISVSASRAADAMIRVYRNMALSVFTSMITAYTVSHNQLLTDFFLTGSMQFVILIIPLIMIFTFIPILNNTKSYIAGHILLQGFSAIMGLSLGSIFLHYQSADITSAFLGASVLFTTMAVYGTVTKKDLTSIGQFMYIGLIALIIGGVINLFIGSTVTDLVLSSIGIIVFLGITAYDAQQIRESVRYGEPNAEIVGALSMYLNFINLFMDLLRIFSAGSSRD